MMGRTFFKKAVAIRARGIVPKIRKVRPVYKGLTLVEVVGVKRPMAMHSRDAAKQLGRSKGGLTLQRTGKCLTRFTSETGRQAALKAWQTRWRKVRGIRRGRRVRNRSYVKREPLRQHYTRPVCEGGICFEPIHRQWFENMRRISERTALTKLGHLPRRSKGYVPVGPWHKR